MSADRAMTLLADASLRQYPAEGAVQLERMRPREVSAVLERVEPLVVADVLRRLRGDRAAHVAVELTEPAASRLLGALEPMTAAAILARLDDAQRESRLERLEPALSRELRELMAYPAGVAGSIMNPRVPGFRGEVTAREALSQLRASRAHVSDIFIGDSDGKLAGSVYLQELALAETGARLEDIMSLAPARVQALAPHDELTAIAEDRRVRWRSRCEGSRCGRSGCGTGSAWRARSSSPAR